MQAVIVSVGRVRGRPDTVFNRSIEYAGLAVPNGQGGFIVGRQPFTDELLITASGRGDGFVVVDRKVAAQANPSVHVVRYSEKGQIIFDTRIPYRPIKIAPDLQTRALDRLFRPYSKASGLKREDFAKVMLVPSHHPSVTSTLIGSDSTIWLRREDLSGITTRWTVLSPDGAVVGTAQIPSVLRVLSVSMGGIVAAPDDQEDPPFLVLLSVKRNTPNE
jgi:hypothetical protein